jgi:hypothetical protein
MAFNPINIPYNWGSNVSDPRHRNSYPGSDVLGNGLSPNNKNMGLAPGLYTPPTLSNMAAGNTQSVARVNNDFLYKDHYPSGTMEYFLPQYGRQDLQEPRPKEAYKNMFMQKAGDTLHLEPDATMAVFFSDANIEHLLTSVVNKVRSITAESGVAGNNEGVTIMKPNIQDFFNFMIYYYRNYKAYNGSICFINLRNQDGSVKDSVAKLNTSVLQDYVSKMVSQINMYIYYYIDASRLPEQLSNPVMTSMKGSRSLEYNTGFYSGNSTGVASYNEVGNIM